MLCWNARERRVDGDTTHPVVAHLDESVDAVLIELASQQILEPDAAM